MRFPPAPRRRRRWPARILGVLATAAFLGTGVVIALMVLPEPSEQAAPETRGPASPKLTAGQRAERRAAVATLKRQGYEPVRLADWRPASDLRVLIGRDDGGAERAFFFVGRRFVGNDDAAASGALRVSRTGERSVTLAYRLYEPLDRPCCPSGETVTVRFRRRDGRLVPAGDVPPAASRVAVR